MDTASHTVRHFLAAIAYRFQKAVRGAPEGFGGFAAGHGVRTPRAIVHHVNGVLGYLREGVAAGDPDHWYHHPELDWSGEVAAVHDALHDLDRLLATRADWRVETLHRMLQGPLADAMTHVGQLAMLRRMAGSPVPSENFFKAHVRAGRVGTDQPEPASPDA